MENWKIIHQQFWKPNQVQPQKKNAYLQDGGKKKQQQLKESFLKSSPPISI
jgi:hypothetical protein